jgi:hypothetical protein
VLLRQLLLALAYARAMCAGCALAAMTGASATRSWLQAQHITWLTPKRMRVATVVLFTAATIGSSATLGGSSTPVKHAPQSPASVAATSQR